MHTIHNDQCVYWRFPELHRIPSTTEAGYKERKGRWIRHGKGLQAAHSSPGELGEKMPRYLQKLPRCCDVPSIL